MLTLYGFVQIGFRLWVFTFLLDWEGYKKKLETGAHAMRVQIGF